MAYHEPLDPHQRNTRRWHPPDIPQGLALFRTCQQAEAEATTILYSSNTLYFDDTAEAWLLRYSNDLYQTQMLSTNNTAMHAWLHTIGEKNRRSIKHIQMKFGAPTFNLCWAYNGFSLYNRPFIGDDYLCRALSCLLKDHGLQILELVFSTHESRDHRDTDHWDGLAEYVMRGLLCPGNVMREALATIRGICELKFTFVEGDDLTTGSNSSAAALRARGRGRILQTSPLKTDMLAADGIPEHQDDTQSANLITWLKSVRGLRLDYIEKVAAGFKELRAEMQSESPSVCAPSNSRRFSNQPSTKSLALDENGKAKPFGSRW